MKQETKVLIGIFLAVVLLVAGGVWFLTQSAPQVTPTGNGAVYDINYATGQKVGSDSAKVKLVEFSDLQCPACGAFHPSVKEILASPSADFQFVFKHFPLATHVHARKAASFAEAAGEQGKFWEMIDRQFETQSEWSSLPNPDEFFYGLVKELGLDEARVKQAIEQNKYASRVQEDLSEGNRLGVNATPTFYLNGKKLSLKSFADLKKAVDAALQQ